MIGSRAWLLGKRRLPDTGGTGLALSQSKTCKSERESYMYCEKVMRTFGPGRWSLCKSHQSFAW